MGYRSELACLNTNLKCFHTKWVFVLVLCIVRSGSCAVLRKLYILCSDIWERTVLYRLHQSVCTQSRLTCLPVRAVIPVLLHTLVFIKCRADICIGISTYANYSFLQRLMQKKMALVIYTYQIPSEVQCCSALISFQTLLLNCK